MGSGRAKEQAARILPPNWAVSERDYVRFIKTRMKNGRPICIKYPLGQKAGLLSRLRGVSAGFAARPFLRALPPIPAAEKNLLECAKLRAFKAAGLDAPDILAVQNGFSIFADTGRNIDDILPELRARNPALHDTLLIGCGRALGQIHAAGLCLGRVDLRNMYLAAHSVGFLGFKDYPERFMPQAQAQMRDIWFLLLHISAKALNKDHALAAAFRTWRRQVGLEVLEELRANARFFRFSLRAYRLVPPLFWRQSGRDKARVLRFLAANLGI